MERCLDVWSFCRQPTSFERILGSFAWGSLGLGFLGWGSEELKWSQVALRLAKFTQTSTPDVAKIGARGYFWICISIPVWHCGRMCILAQLGCRSIECQKRSIQKVAVFVTNCTYFGAQSRLRFLDSQDFFRVTSWCRIWFFVGLVWKVQRCAIESWWAELSSSPRCSVTSNQGQRTVETVEIATLSARLVMTLVVYWNSLHVWHGCPTQDWVFENREGCPETKWMAQSKDV